MKHISYVPLFRCLVVWHCFSFPFRAFGCCAFVCLLRRWRWDLPCSSAIGNYAWVRMHAVTRGIILTTRRAQDAAGQCLATPSEDTRLPSSLRTVAGAAVLKDVGCYKSPLSSIPWVLSSTTLTTTLISATLIVNSLCAVVVILDLWKHCLPHRDCNSLVPVHVNGLVADLGGWSTWD